MATLTKGYTFSSTEQVTAAKLHSLVDSASISSIVAADIADNTITDTKIASVGGAKLLTLGSTPAGAGILPVANGGTGLAAYTQGDVPYASGTTTIAKLGAGTAGQALTTGGAGANPSFAGMTTQGDIEYHNGTTRTRLAKGAALQQLRMNSGATAPEWATSGQFTYSGASVYSGNAPTSYTDLDLSATIGSSRCLVLLYIKKANSGTSGISYAFRTNGVTDEVCNDGSTVGATRFGAGTVGCTLQNNYGATIFIVTDTSGIIEWKDASAAGSQSTDISVLAYVVLA